MYLQASVISLESAPIVAAQLTGYLARVVCEARARNPASCTEYANQFAVSSAIIGAFAGA